MSGIQKQVLVMGNGSSPKSGDSVTVHYTGKFLNEVIFDTSISRGQPFVFSIDRGQVIPGWDIALKTMALNETSIFIIPPEMAYGRHGAPPTIPPNSTLLFEITLLKIN